MSLKLLHSETVKGEKRWTYKIKIILNKLSIVALTITDHYQQKHPEITNELIWELMKRLNGLRREETSYQGQRKVYKWEDNYLGKKYRLIFWFKDNVNNHLWVRNCYLID